MLYGKGRIESEINHIGLILKELDLLEERMLLPKNIPSALAVFRNMNYIDTWQYYLKSQHYNFLLVDSSIFFFNNKDHSYIFIACPFQGVSYYDFVIDKGYDYDEIRDGLRDDYEIYLQGCKTFEFPLMIRYDYDPNKYIQGQHPASHLHFGYNNLSRIGNKKIISPLSFLFFILRQCYPNKWQSFISRSKNRSIISNHNNGLNNINSTFFQGLDLLELYLAV